MGARSSNDAVRLVVGSDRVALCGALREVTTHTHSSAAVVVGLDGPLEFRAGRTHRSRAVLLAPGFCHAVGVERSRLAVFLLPPHAVAATSVGPLRDLAYPGRWIELGSALLRDELTSFAPIDRCLARERLAMRPIDERLSTATTMIAETLDENLPIEAIAADAKLSASRLMALAREQLGTSLRSYRRWLRTFQVARRYAAGASLTEAAYASGFSSSAHLAAAAREHFGIRPSQVLSPTNRPAILPL